MRAWILIAALSGCGDKADSGSSDSSDSSDTNPTEIAAGCQTWVQCCEHQCGTDAEYKQWVKDDINCDVECDSASPGPLTESCVQDDAGACDWAP